MAPHSSDNSTAAQPAPPQAEAELTLADFAYVIPPIRPGQHILKLVNVGQEPHEILVKRLAPGKTQADALAFVLDPQGTPPYDDAGGLLRVRDIEGDDDPGRPSVREGRR